MKKVGGLSASALLAGCANGIKSDNLPPKKKLNVLLIIVDDLNTNLGCYGNEEVQSPNIDALARRGVRFEHLYCQYPLCGPSRCSFLSGLRPDTVGVLQNRLPVRYKLKNVMTLPQLFRLNGYFSARCGKVFHLGIPKQVGQSGPDDPASWDYTFNPKGNEFPVDEDEHNPTPQWAESNRRVMLRGNGQDQHDYEAASEAIRLMNQHKEGPFFLAVGFIRPHVPEIAPKKYFNLYDINKIHMPYNPPDDRDDKPPLDFVTSSLVPNMGMNDMDCRQSIRAYHASTSFMDAQVGRVLAELDRLHLRSSTIIVFMSDHGYLLGQHQAWSKMMLFEEACRIPLIISAPTMTHRDACAPGLAESIDLFPTLAELASLPPPSELQGKSLVPLLENPDRPFKSAVFSQVLRDRDNTSTGRSVRTARWRYTEWDGGKSGAELFDHDADPREFKNLVKDPKYAQTVIELHRLLILQ